MSSVRTDRNNNPTAFTTALAAQGLQEGIDYLQGEPFADRGVQYFTARLLGDPIEKTIRLIDRVGFYNKHGDQRWVYIGIPRFVWDSCTSDEKKKIIGFMYQREGGTELKPLFA